MRGRSALTRAHSEKRRHRKEAGGPRSQRKGSGLSSFRLFICALLSCVCPTGGPGPRLQEADGECSYGAGGARQGRGQDSEQCQRTHLARFARKTAPAGRGPWPHRSPPSLPTPLTTLLLYSASRKPPSPLPWGREAWHLSSISSLGCLASNSSLCCGPGCLSSSTCCERAKQIRLGSADTCRNVDGPWGHSAKWAASQRRQMHVILLQDRVF